MVTVAGSDQSFPGSKLDPSRSIDIRDLSQSELHALSLCSDSVFDLRGSDDVVIPCIDRSVFNESAGSRRQTYARSRLNPRPRLTASEPPPPSHDPEDKFIINSLKRLIDPNYSSITPPLPPRTFVSDQANGAQQMAIVLGSGERKRKRGRKPGIKKPQGSSFGIELEFVNRNGMPIDFGALIDADDVYSSELKRRTTGLETEEDVLGFLRGLEGQWGSRRRKRKIVNACQFGDSLPVGWKILLGLKRREGRVSVYCRRFISPTGQQFLSCKEAASFLLSYFGCGDANWPGGQSAGFEIGYRKPADFHHISDDMSQDILSKSTIVVDAHLKNSLMDIDSLPDVLVRDIFDCYKCNLSFDERDVYLQHLLSFHEKTMKRFEISSPVGGGVVIRDEKYECQFCYKVFLERSSYNDHTSIHLENLHTDFEELAGTLGHNTSGSPPQDQLPSKLSKIDTSIEIADTSILESSNMRHDNKSSDSSFTNKLNLEEISFVDVVYDFSNCREVEINDFDGELTQQGDITVTFNAEQAKKYDIVDVVK